MPELPKPTGLKVGVVGSGPAGLTLAGALIKKGVAVTVFEALHELGGVSRLRHPGVSSPQGHRPVRGG